MAHVKLWLFADAPEKYKSLSTSGGDEDFLALVPKDLLENYWILERIFSVGSGFAVCDVEEVSHDDGLIVIGSHA